MLSAGSGSRRWKLRGELSGAAVGQDLIDSEMSSLKSMRSKIHTIGFGSLGLSLHR